MLWIWKISYVDVIIATGSLFVLSATVNRIIRKRTQKKSSEHIQVSILNDRAILSATDDLLDVKEEAQRVANVIQLLDNKSMWSISITAPWGNGKTSFINLITEKLKDSDYIFLYFNPRNSKSFQSIQEDFFSQLSCILSKYDSRCSLAIKDYMSSLQLIDQKGLIERVAKIYKIWNKRNLKELINTSFLNLHKRVLVVIDDFDRLSKEEIFEVLKIIDGNAAFPNIVFLTAYDKEQVNKILGPAYQGKDASFSDKFFTLEFPLPVRSYIYKYSFLIKNLTQRLHLNDNEVSQFKTAINNNLDLLNKSIVNLRDAKRLLNQITLDYMPVQGDVYVDEFLLVQLVKYKYPEFYYPLYNNEYTQRGGILTGNRNTLYRKDNIDNTIAIYPIICKLFPDQKSSIGSTYRHIYSIDSFDNYFVNRIYSPIRIKEIEDLLAADDKKIFSKLDKWCVDTDKLSSIIDFFANYEIDKAVYLSTFYNYVTIVSYLATRFFGTRTYSLFMRIISENRILSYLAKLSIEKDDYSKKILRIINNDKYDHTLRLIREMHVNFKTNDIQEESVIIKDTDILPTIKAKFFEYIKENGIDEASTLWLYQCVDHIESNGKLILDKDCLIAFRNDVERNPSYYIKHNIRLGGVSSSEEFNSITCEPFWEQIWENAETFEAFIRKCKEEDLNGSEVSLNFWKLYKSNDFNPIEFNHQGSVQAKIDNDLKEEVKILEEIQSIQRTIDGIPHSKEGLSVYDIDKFKTYLIEASNNISSINLNISAAKKLRKEIIKKQNIY